MSPKYRVLSFRQEAGGRGQEEIFKLYFSQVKNAIVHLGEGTYEKGVKVLAKELEALLPFWQRSETLPKWDVTVVPS
jgi:hypothetical protein